MGNADTPKTKLQRLLEYVAVDPTPLKISRDYRLFFGGQAVSSFGSMMTYAVFPLQMYQLTKSNVYVGLIGIVEFAPMFVLALIGGALADSVDRRKLIISLEIMKALLIGLLVVNALLAQPKIWALFAVTFFYAAVAALQRPAIETILPNILGADHMPAASALGSLRYNFAAIAGPALGGAIASIFGVAFAYGIDVATFLVSLLTLSLMNLALPREHSPGVSLNSISEGLRYSWQRKELFGTYIIDFIAMFFGMPMALFPAMAENFGQGSIGLLYAMPAVGAFLTSLTSGWANKIYRHGLAVAIAATVWGFAIIGFGWATKLWLALLFLALAGAADMVSGLFRMTMWNQTIPDRIRGRMAGIELISYTTGPMLGNAEAGLVAGVFGLRASVISGGILCVIGAVGMSLLLPQFIRYDGREGLRQKQIEEELFKQ